MSACNRRRDRFLIALLDDSGLRISEALGLRHADLNLRKGEVHVVPRENNANRARVKGMKGRIVPVRPELFDRYAAYMESEYGTLDCDFVSANLCRKPIGSPMTRANVNELVERLQKRTGIAHFSPHACRHTYATRLLRADVPIEVVAELLGHASPQTTAETYSHLNVEDHRRALLSAGIIQRQSILLVRRIRRFASHQDILPRNNKIHCQGVHIPGAASIHGLSWSNVMGGTGATVTTYQPGLGDLHSQARRSAWRSADPPAVTALEGPFLGGHQPSKRSGPSDGPLTITSVTVRFGTQAPQGARARRSRARATGGPAWGFSRSARARPTPLCPRPSAASATTRAHHTRRTVMRAHSTA
ncbi:tyrosine-type recombinase/integrase [Streptomyces atratus]|uniref:tyrosine-type recombinase/integrase n=1 Tax=Streptomyces atratus TaxID=1893 RepID=UPI0033F8AED3